MLEKIGKFFRSLFTEQPKSVEQPAPVSLGKPIDDRVEATAPTVEAPAPIETKPEVKPKRQRKDNVVVAPIKKQKAVPAVPAVEPKARKPRTPKK